MLSGSRATVNGKLNEGRTAANNKFLCEARLESCFGAPAIQAECE